ncbi:MAG: phosphodiesterase [Acidiferrobacterales bacterium]
MKFIQVTDMHIMPPGERLMGLDPRAQLDACIADINAHHADAELCVFTGDLGHEGYMDAYRNLRECLSALSIPYHLMLGNHDDRDAFKMVFPEIVCDEHGFVQFVIDTTAGRFILLDSHEPGAGWGSFCDKRAGWLQARLEESRDRAAYLFIHHPPFEIGIPSLDRIRLLEADLLRETIARYDNIKHIFFGHVHRPIAGSYLGIPCSFVRGTNHQVAFDFHTTRPVPKNHEPPAYAVVLLNSDSVVVHMHDFLDNSVLPITPGPATTE